jgi:hypothetical protein
MFNNRRKTTANLCLLLVPLAGLVQGPNCAALSVDACWQAKSLCSNLAIEGCGVFQGHPLGLQSQGTGGPND